MARHSQKFRSGRNPSNSFAQAATHVSDAIGPKWTFVVIALVVVGVFGGINSIHNAAQDAEAAEINAVEVLSHRPDGLDEKCMKNLVRSYFAESSVERAERAELESRIKSGSNCKQ